jgi:hypothetical protein
MKYNIWLQKRAIKNIKSKCKFVLYQNVGSSLGVYYEWSEVYWTNEAMHSHDHISFDEENQTLSWIIPEECHVDGFCVVHDDKGTLITQRINHNGVHLYQGEQIHLDISAIHVLP